MKTTIPQVSVAIARERLYQDRKWGDLDAHPHEVAGWLLIMHRELQEAMTAWVEAKGDADALREVLQVVAVGVACLQQHGVVERKPVSPLPGEHRDYEVAS